MICKDIFFHVRYSCVYPFISFVSSSFFIDVLHFILTYSSFYPSISSFILLFYPFYPAILSLLSCYFIPFILLFYPFYPDIYPAGYSIRSWADPDRHCVCLIGPSFACPAQQQGKPLCFYFPAPSCGHRWLPLLAAPVPGPSPHRHGFPLLPVPPAGIGGDGGVGGSGEWGRRWWWGG